MVEKVTETRIVASHVNLAKPLDYSFLKIDNILSIKKMLPRGGKRKPIIESDDEEERTKKEEITAAAEE
jgi:hypothetical protein